MRVIRASKIGIPTRSGLRPVTHSISPLCPPFGLIARLSLCKGRSLGCLHSQAISRYRCVEPCMPPMSALNSNTAIVSCHLTNCQAYLLSYMAIQSCYRYPIAFYASVDECVAVLYLFLLPCGVVCHAARYVEHTMYSYA